MKNYKLLAETAVEAVQYIEDVQLRNVAFEKIMDELLSNADLCPHLMPKIWTMPSNVIPWVEGGPWGFPQMESRDMTAEEIEKNVADPAPVPYISPRTMDGEK